MYSFSSTSGVDGSERLVGGLDVVWDLDMEVEVAVVVEVDARVVAGSIRMAVVSAFISGSTPVDESTTGAVRK